VVILDVNVYSGLKKEQQLTSRWAGRSWYPKSTSCPFTRRFISTEPVLWDCLIATLCNVQHIMSLPQRRSDIREKKLEAVVLKSTV